MYVKCTLCIMFTYIIYGIKKWNHCTVLWYIAQQIYVFKQNQVTYYVCNISITSANRQIWWSIKKKQDMNRIRFFQFRFRMMYGILKLWNWLQLLLTFSLVLAWAESFPSRSSLSTSASRSRKRSGSRRANMRMTAGVWKAALIAACVAYVNMYIMVIFEKLVSE